MAAANAPVASVPLPEPLPIFAAPAGWRAIDFISDLHLSVGLPRTVETWAAYLRHTDADAVFILGDLFEAWVGDDAATEGFEASCMAVLREASRRRTIGFMAGNRDFLVGDRLLASAGLTRLADPTVVSAFGQRALLSHGDALCLGDVDYQRFRRVVRRPIVQRTFLSLPLAWRRTLGRTLRGRSASRDARPSRAGVDLDAGATVDWLDRSRASVMVHGHTHAPASHALPPERMRHVLSDWDLDGPALPRAEVLRWTASGFRRLAPADAMTPGPVSPSRR